MLSNRRRWVIGTQGGERNNGIWPYYSLFAETEGETRVEEHEEAEG